MLAAPLSGPCPLTVQVEAAAACYDSATAARGAEALVAGRIPHAVMRVLHGTLHPNPELRLTAKQALTLLDARASGTDGAQATAPERYDTISWRLSFALMD